MDTKKYRLLDLCCKAGGCSVGYSRAGFEVVGVDLDPQPNYPFEFHRGNAFEYDWHGFDVIHASPHCQGYSQVSLLRPNTQQRYDREIAKFREFLIGTGKPYIIENVEGARRDMIDPIMLCGAMFGLTTYRHRLFESNMRIYPPPHLTHIHPVARPAAIPGPNEFWSICGKFGKKEQAAYAMGIDWMKTVGEIANAIPPSYTEWIGVQLIEILGKRE